MPLSHATALAGRAREIQEGDQESLRRLARGSLIEELGSSMLSGRPGQHAG